MLVFLLECKLFCVDTASRTNPAMPNAATGWAKFLFQDYSSVILVARNWLTSHGDSWNNAWLTSKAQGQAPVRGNDAWGGEGGVYHSLPAVSRALGKQGESLRLLSTAQDPIFALESCTDWQGPEGKSRRGALGGEPEPLLDWSAV